MSQHNQQKNLPLQLSSRGNDAKSDASTKPASLQGGHLGEVCQPRSKRQEPRPTRRDAASCGSGREGLAVPAGRCQRRGNQAGCLAAWLSGWQGRLRGWLGDHVAPLCKLKLGTTPVSPPSPIDSPRIPPLSSTAGLTDARKAPEDSTQLHALSEVRPK